MQTLNIFRFGQVGTALDGFRESEIASQSANSIKNFYISEMGTLRVAKKYKTIKIADSEILGFRDTKYNFFIIITATEIISVNKDTKVKIFNRSHGLNLTTNFNHNIFNDFIFIQGTNKLSVFKFDTSGNIGTTNFFETIKLPFQNKQEVKIDYYKVFKTKVVNPEYTSGGSQPMYIDEFRPEIMASYDNNLELAVSDTGKIVLKNLGVEINRTYRQFKSALSKDDISDLVEGMTILVFRNYRIEEDGATYHFGNYKVTFTGETVDAKYGSSYFTGASPNGANGLLVYGILENFLEDIVDVVEYQSRLVIASSEKVYFSKSLDYNNFVPEIENDGAFFIKPAPIDGNQPKILKLTTGTGLYISCAKGTIVVGYGSHLTPSNSMNSVRIAGNSPMTKLSALVEDDFYYVDATGKLRCILLNVDSGVVQFTNNIAEKYSFVKGNIKSISRGVINEDNVLLATMLDSEEVRVYKKVDENLFRNFSLVLDNTYPYLGYNEHMISGMGFLELTELNVDNAELVLNMPAVSIKGRGNYLSDFELTYKRIVLNMLNTNKAVKGVTIIGREVPPKPIQNLSITEGNYNIYDLESTVSIIHPKIEIATIGSVDVIELRGIDLL